ncbi:MAG TPA: hypothetical protein VK578_11020 [Edaphobacter sp.]|nr:hypothetical protein [Edaphobacter sp.]
MKEPNVDEEFVADDNRVDGYVLHGSASSTRSLRHSHSILGHIGPC